MTLSLITILAVLIFLFAGVALSHTLQENSLRPNTKQLVKQYPSWFTKFVAYYCQYDIVWVWDNGHVIPTYRNQNLIKVKGNWYNMVESDRYFDGEMMVRGNVVYSELNEILGYYYV